MCQNRVISMKLQRNWLALKLFDAPLQHFRHWRQGCRIDICNPSFPLSFVSVYLKRKISLPFLLLIICFSGFDCMLSEPSEGSFVKQGKLMEAVNQHSTKPHFHKFNVLRSVQYKMQKDFWMFKITYLLESIWLEFTYFTQITVLLK